MNQIWYMYGPTCTIKMIHDAAQIIWKHDRKLQIITTDILTPPTTSNSPVDTKTPLAYTIYTDNDNDKTR